MHTKMGAVDIGGTKISVGIVDEGGSILTEKNFKTILGKEGAIRSMEKILEILNEQCGEQGILLKDLSGIGIVCAGPVDTRHGIVENFYTLPGWEGFSLADYLKGRTGLPVKLENDAKGALMGEVLTGGLRNKRVLMIMFGTGIGAAFWDAKGVYDAGDGYHPEMGHIIVSSQDRHCYCHHAGCFESLCSGSALNARAKEAGYIDFDGLYQAYKNGEAGAVGLLDCITTEIQNGVWSLALIFKPDVVILGGGVMKTYFPFFSERLKEDLQNRTDFVNEYKILPAGKNSNSALAGISMMFDEE